MNPVFCASGLPADPMRKGAGRRDQQIRPEKGDF